MLYIDKRSWTSAEDIIALNYDCDTKPFLYLRYFYIYYKILNKVQLVEKEKRIIKENAVA